MIKSFIKTIFIIFICLAHQHIVASESSKKDCEFDANKVHKEFYTTLYKNRDITKANSYLKQKRPCVSNKYQAALITDMSAELLRYMYERSNKHEISIKSEKLYLKALKFNTKHNEVILYHLAVLYHSQKNYSKAAKTISRGLKLKAKNPMPMLSIALMVAVDAGNWDQAKELVDILINKDRFYYMKIPLLSSTVKTLCYYGQQDTALMFIKDVENKRPNLNSNLRKMLSNTQKIANSCGR